MFRIIGHAGEGGRADWFLAKLAFAALLSGNVMMFQSMTYFGSLDALGSEVLRTSSWIMFACSLSVFALLGVPMLRLASRGLRRGHLSLEALIGFGALAAIGYSAVQTLHGGRDLYYDSGTMVLVFVVLGQYLEAEARRRALALLKPTLGKLRRKARLIREGIEVQIAPGSVRAGEIVHVRAGEEIPVDGAVVAGTADVSEPLLTGEWRPRLAALGSYLYAGSTALDGALEIRASGAGESLQERIERFAVEARESRAPIEAAVDRIVGVFVPAVLLIATAACVLWGVDGQWQRGFQAAMAVLVVACPCALGIATPMASSMASSFALRRGVVVKGGAVWEALSRIRILAFDKTGTVTLGRPQVTSYHPISGSSQDAAAGLRLAAAVEVRVDHPVARALVAAAEDGGLSLPAAGEVRTLAGGGAWGQVEDQKVAVGKLSWLANSGIEMPPGSTNGGGSSVGIAVDGRLIGEVVLDDRCRPEAAEAFEALRVAGITCHLLSGDGEAAVSRVARTLSCRHFLSDLSPTAKVQHIRGLRRAGLVAMVGDGVNDAPALGAADVGMAFGLAADPARESADVVLPSEDLREIPLLLDLARRTFRIVRQNLCWAFAYNSIAIIMAACGLLRPIVAAAAMVLSSLCVIHNSMRIARSDKTFPGGNPS
ncbi:MAG TPA: heavy metal translocating P-type ATPase [Steroidobacteraceae bacterium]